jgi:predicted nucleic-acid-binding Zn-ribbon protein
MTSTEKEEENKKNTNTIKEETEKLLDQQKQQISDATDKFNENINDYQIIEKSIDTTGKYQQQAINTFQSITNNFVELQKNLLETYQSVISRFLDVTAKSYRNNSPSSQKYTDIYNKSNQTITDNTINATNRINDAVLGSTETFNKSIEIAQKYYNDSIQNYFNFLKKLERSSNQ